MPSPYQRNTTIDAIKAFAIVCVVVAHCIEYGSGLNYLSLNLFFNNPLFKVITSFHMPLFMLVSGHLFGYSVSRGSISQVIQKRANGLLLPLFCWNIVALTVYLLSFVIHDSPLLPVSQFAQWFIHSLFYNFWFLWAVWWCALITAISHYYFKDNLYFILATLAITLILPNRHHVDYYSFMLPYFFIGYGYCTKRTDRTWEKKHRYVLLIVSLISFIILYFFYNPDTYIYTTGHCILQDGRLSFRQLSIDIFRFTIGLCGSIFFILLIDWIYPMLKHSNQTIALIGRNSLGIYIISDILFNDHLLRLVSTKMSGVNYWVLCIETLIVIVTSVLITLCIQKNRFANRLLLGGR